MNNIFKMDILDIIIYLILPLQICMVSTIINTLIPISINFFVYIMLFVLCLIYLKKNNYKIYLSESIKRIYIGAILCFFIMPVIACNIESISGFIYVILLMICLFSYSVISQKITERISEYLLIWTVLCIIIVDVHVLLNLKEITNNTLVSVFNVKGIGYDRYRALFGFSHPNFTAIVISTVIILCYLVYKFNVELKNKRFFIILGFCNIIPLLCTGSRTACFCLFVFFGLEFFLSFLIKLKSSSSQVIIIMILLVVSIIMAYNINISDVNELSSGRYETILDSLKILSDENKVLFGSTVTNVSDASSSFKKTDTGVEASDNWYYMHIVRFGLVGFILFLFPLLDATKKMYKYVMTSQAPTCYFSLMVYIFIYGIGENVVFNQGIVLSTLVWIVFFYGIYISELEEKKSFQCKLSYIC